ncbi:hypothetical protein CYMTET_2864 [Cymbomonas tetramitiformis]|uniref:Uncharacterized protein n=1 Tax=Cymbomonas tetramitiformis TaxID=36881 RepID=A0AAE0H494_9CHLO|nr:hypothetical protein CYMTET_2864 [Cymbomonas tetramitiformis]
MRLIKIRNTLLTQETPLMLAMSAAALFIGLFVLMWYMKWFPSYYFDLYSDEVIFFDTYNLDSRGKALAALAVSFVLTSINVYVRRTVSSWQINYLNSPHIPRSNLQSALRLQTTMFAYTVFVSLSGAVNIFLIFSNFWFLATQMAANIMVTFFMTSIFLKEKERAEVQNEHMQNMIPPNTSLLNDDLLRMSSPTKHRAAQVTGFRKAVKANRGYGFHTTILEV